MPAPYSQDLRDRVAAAVAAGASARAAAERFGVSMSTAIRWAQRWRAAGHVRARRMGGDHRSRLKEHRAAVLELIARHPDLTLEEIRRALAASGISVGLSTVWRFVKAHKLTRKKNPTCRRAEPPRCSRGAAGVHPPSAGARSRSPDLHRRDLGEHQYDPPLRPGAPRAAAAGRGAARSLEGDDRGGRLAHQRDHRALRVRRRHQWRPLSRRRLPRRKPGSSRCWCPACSPATSSFSTI
jgi:transposase